MGTMRVDSKGRITLPRELREALCLEPDDKVAYECENGILRIAKAGNPFDALVEFAIAQRRAGKGISLEDFAAREGIDLDDE